MIEIYGVSLESRLMLGTAHYPSPAIMEKVFEVSRASVATVSLRRENVRDCAGRDFWNLIKKIPNIKLLPNTAGCYSVKEAVSTAYMAREFFETDWIKLEVIGDLQTLHPNVFDLIEAAKILIDDGFKIFPYTNDDLVVAEKLVNLGCKVLMPFAAPIGSAMGINNYYSLSNIRKRFPEISLIVDAGLGLPSHATSVMEIGYDAVLLNTAIAKAVDPVEMSLAFSHAVIAGHKAYNSGPVTPCNIAVPSTSLFGRAFYYD